jgi:hypothetical protein
MQTARLRCQCACAATLLAEIVGFVMERTIVPPHGRSRACRFAAAPIVALHGCAWRVD